MSTEIRHFDTDGRAPWLVIDTRNYSARYFNGRAYRVSNRMEHYIHPNNHSRNFSDHTTSVVLVNGWHTKSMRYSQVGFGFGTGDFRIRIADNGRTF